MFSNISDFGSRKHSAFKKTLLGCSLLSVFAMAQAGFQDPLEVPAQKRTNVTQRPYMALTAAGTNMVAVGSRGLIAHSADRGATWQQADVPVQADLLAVHFSTATNGWAVGHDGVVLHSSDAGKSWAKQLDGRASAQAFQKYYMALGNGFESFAAAAANNFKAEAPLPFLDVWFADAGKGYAVGSFGVIAGTGDGGKTWEPLLHKISNEQNLNLNAISGIAGELYIAAEKGQIFKLDRSTDRFVRVDTGYAGSFFGIVGDANVLLAFGLRGVVYRSNDQGKTWEAVPMPSEQTITGGAKTESGFVLVNVLGQLLVAGKDGRKFNIIQPEQGMRMTGVAALDGNRCVFSGLAGLKAQACPK